MKKSKLTAFEWQVLRATMRIPLGQTRSYKWVAKAVGKPKAARAVGQALKNNPFLLIVPCHRVVQAGGAPGGYAGGKNKKKTLLQLEKEIAAQFRRCGKGK